MAYKILISKEAEIELETAECFFKTRNVNREFLEDFSRQLDFLKTNPYSFQVRYREVRILQFKQFNYSIQYIVKEQNVMILRILNQRQDF